MLENQNTQKYYEPKSIENTYYKIWENGGNFTLDGNKAIQKYGKNFAIMMPPPNVTGKLHIGHALTFALQDIIVRYKRMDGYAVLWQSGLDHAGIATQNVVEKQLLAKGIKKEDIGREEFVKKVWEWKEESGGIINHQMRRLGVSPDFNRGRFTMDDGLKNAVKEVFIKLYEEDLIVRDNYMVNWCTHDGALSDIEVEYSENDGKLYYIKYPLVDSDKFLIVATTRPETMFGDTAVMVNPDDVRYTEYIGQEIALPLTNRKIKIIKDSHVDSSFGSVVVKVTPAHDINDYEVGKRHNLEFLTVFDKNGILNEYAGEFKGLERLESREKIVQKLQSLNLLEKIESHKNQIGKCYRCGNVIEPYISKQWFVKKEIAKKSIEKLNNNEAKFFPPMWKNNYDAWMRELRDWCISRQLWWGHRIPVFYCDDCNHTFVSRNDVESSCPRCKGGNVRQDEDVLDTWFSSGLWSFSTLGYLNGDLSKNLYNKDDMERFYPNSLLITGFDILFFWVARMIMMGENVCGKLPFKDIYLHALVRDEHGNKMSKSKGNIIDPLEVIEEYSSDILRFTLAILATQGRDIKLSNKDLELYKNFTNKLYNAGQYLLLNAKSFPNLCDIEVKTPLGKYMQSRLNLATSEIRGNLETYRFNDGASVLYRFFWSEFCDIGIELSKSDKDSTLELGAIYKEALLFLHPYMPFISEYLHRILSGKNTEQFNGRDSIMLSPYPTNLSRDENIEKDFNIILDSAQSIRRAKIAIGIGNQRIQKAYIKAKVDEKLALQFLPKLAKVETISFVDSKPESCIVDIGEFSENYIEVGSIDLNPIIDKLFKQKDKATKDILKLESMLNNKSFVKNAQESVINTNTNLLNEAKNKLESMIKELDILLKFRKN